MFSYHTWHDGGREIMDNLIGQITHRWPVVRGIKVSLKEIHVSLIILVGFENILKIQPPITFITQIDWQKS
jgi:hypothetical protein